jgi:hypothetical protein
MGLRKWFEAVGITNVTELEWGQCARFNDRITVVATPAQHW